MVKKYGSKFMAILLTLVIVVGLIPVTTITASAAAWGGSTASAFAGGDGSSGTPYQIATGEQLAYMAAVINGAATNATYASKYYELTADIDLNSQPWTPIGASITYSFSGNFNGNNHVVSNITIGTSGRRKRSFNT